MTPAAILDELQRELAVAVESCPWLVGAAIAGAIACALIHLLHRKRLAVLHAQLRNRDEQLTRARSELTTIGRDLQALGDERQARQNLEAVVDSLRQQLARAREQPTATPPAAPPPRGDPVQASLDRLFDPGSAIDPDLTPEEAKRLLLALRELTDLTRAMVGSGAAPGSGPVRVRLPESNGPAWWSYVSRHGIAHAIDLVSAFRADVLGFANALEQVIARQPELEFRLRKIVGNVGAVAVLLNATGGFIRSLERLDDGETYNPTVLAMALGPAFRTMIQAQSAAEAWMRAFLEQRVPAVCREAAAYAEAGAS